MWLLILRRRVQHIITDHKNKFDKKPCHTLLMYHIQYVYVNEMYIVANGKEEGSYDSPCFRLQFFRN